MPLRVTYSDPQGEDEPTVSVELAESRIRFGTLAVTQAASIGEAATSGIEIEDPDGDLEIVGLRALTIRETSAGSNNEIILQARTGDRKVKRGPSSITSNARTWSVDLTDYNFHLGARLFTDSDANRPAETAGDRIRWLLTNAAHIHLNDYGHVSYPTYSVDPADYRGQRVTDLLADCAMEGGYNYWCDLNEAHNARELFFMHPGSVEYAATISISNHIDDVDDASTFAPSDDSELTRSPSRIAFGVYLPYANGSVYVRNQTTGEQYAKVDQAAPLSNVKTAARATRVANKFLGDHDEEDDRITTSIWVPASQVNAARPGHLIWAKYAHFPGYESAQPMRITRRTVAQDPETSAYQGVNEDDEARYRLDLELSPATDYPVDAPAGPSCSVAEGDAWYVYFYSGNNGVQSSADTTTFQLVPTKQYRLVGHVDGLYRNRPEAYTWLRAYLTAPYGAGVPAWDPADTPDLRAEPPEAGETYYSEWYTYIGTAADGWINASVGTIASLSTLDAHFWVECV